ncbi:hypothetical protein FACS1894201_01090 [Bacteroidia bacterium]|nr:hypothetical protein FACS1894201_01090 [Bacteroidia bacterium]
MSKTFTGKNIKDTDQQARTAFMEAIANISANEIDLLRLNAGTSFVYSVRRYEDATNPDSDVIVLAEYSYPQS